MTDTLHKTYKDAEGNRHIEIWTDGEWIKVGRDIDGDKCVTFRYEDDWYHDFRRGESLEQFNIEAEHGLDEKYVVWNEGMGTFRFFRGDDLVLKDSNHELGSIRHAYRITKEFREESYDYEDIARSYVNSMLRLDLKIAEVDVNENRGDACIAVVHERDSPRIRLNFVDDLRDDEYVEQIDVMYKDEYENDIGYTFRINAHQIGEDDG